MSNDKNPTDIIEVVEEEEDEEELDEETRNIKMIRRLAESDGKSPSPIDIKVTNSIQIKLPFLIWTNYEKTPKKMKITNSGQTLILSAKWHSIRPFISGGSLDGKYVFSQIHFHWGKTALEGSEHTTDGYSQPLEMHAVHYKSTYKNQNEALLHKDGVVSLAYFFEIKSQHSPVMNRILSRLPDIKLADTSVAIKPFIITDLIYPFESDFYLYWGNVMTSNSDHTLLWLISREVAPISIEQLHIFRLLMDRNMRPIYRNFRSTNESKERKLFHINPLHIYTNTTLSPAPMRLLNENL